MRHILFVQPVFIPDEPRFRQNIRSIESLGDYIATYPSTDNIKISFAFGGWSYSDEMWNEISENIWSLFGVEAVRFERNFGKAYTVNSIITAKSELDYDAILTADSDIVFSIEDAQMFERLYSISDFVTDAKKMDWGIISLNQYEQCCHLPMCYQNKLEFESPVIEYKTEKIVWNNYAGGMGGGCFFINRKMWEAVGGYRVMGVYAGDDACLLMDCKEAGFSWQLADSLGVIHPFGEQDDEYSGWKYAVCLRDSKLGLTKTDISEQIRESEQFWINKRARQ